MKSLAMQSKALFLSVVFALFTSCGDSPSEPGPADDNPTPSVVEVTFTGGWIPPDTSKSITCKAQVTWTACPDSSFASYSLYRSPTPDIEAHPDSAELLRVNFDPADTSWEDKGIDWDREYYYAVRTVNAEELESWSNEVYLYVPTEGSVAVPDHHLWTIDVGAGPGGITTLTSGYLAYVACYYDNSVYVIEPDSPDPLLSITVSSGPFDVCGSDDHVYVSCALNDRVASVRTFDNTVEGYADVGDMPAGICVTPDGQRIYVCSYGSDEVWCLDASSLDVLDTISAGDGPWDIASTPYGDYLYLSCRLDGTVQVLRTSDNTIVSTINAGSEPTGLASSVSGEHIFVCDYAGDQILKIRTSDNTVESTIDVGSCPMNIAVTPNGAAAYVTCYFDDRIDIIDLATDEVVTRLEAGIRPLGACLASSGDFLFVSNSSSNSVIVYDYYEE